MSGIVYSLCFFKNHSSDTSATQNPVQSFKTDLSLDQVKVVDLPGPQSDKSTKRLRIKNVLNRYRKKNLCREDKKHLIHIKTLQ